MKSVFGGELAERTDAAERIALPQADSAVQVTPALHLRALPMRHHEFAPVLGARFEVNGKVVAFTGDTMPNENIITLARDADLLVHDATYCATLNPEYAGGAFGHSTAQDAARHAAQASTRHLALVHIDSMYAGTIAALIDEAQRAYTGRVSAPVAGTLYAL
jgi:ribonuclease BN (tRNA processing enzyme)